MNQRMPIGGRLGNYIRADNSICSCAIINHNTFSHLSVELNRQPARNNVRTTADSKWHYDTQWLCWKSLRKNNGCEQPRNQYQITHLNPPKLEFLFFILAMLMIP